MICEKYETDIKKVTALANTHPRVNIHQSGPGVGGPCLTKDPYLLTHELDSEDQNIVIKARKINDYMPKHMVQLVQEGLATAKKTIANSSITILGTSYKSEVDDARLSPAEPIIHELLQKGGKVTTYDPYCPSTFGAKKAVSLSEALIDSDCLVLVTDHSEFKNLDLKVLKKIMAFNPIIVDGKRIIDPNLAYETGFIYYGIGYKKTQQVKE